MADITIPLTSTDAFWAVVGFAMAGWNLALTGKWRAADLKVEAVSAALSAKIEAEKAATKAELDAHAREIEKLKLKLEIVEKSQWTVEDHKEFRTEVLSLIGELRNSLSASIDKLGDRLENFMREQRGGGLG